MPPTRAPATPAVRQAAPDLTRAYDAAVPRLREIAFVKAHGTGNDFVVVPDEHGRIDLDDADVRFLCDRRRGIGADGVIRVVRTEHVFPEGDPRRAAAWCMDYRNGDGSLAEMCGNGARVFLRYLQAAGLAEGSEVVFATRGGLRRGIIHADRTVTVDMGPASVPRAADLPRVRVGDRTWPAVGVLVPNPHAVAFVTDLADAGDLRTPPVVVPSEAFPEGVNVEFAVERGPGHVAMRVHERGVGETLSCGTGACAVAWASVRRAGEPELPVTTRVDVAGGELEVTERADGSLELRGPAELVARGTVLLSAAEEGSGSA